MSLVAPLSFPTKKNFLVFWLITLFVKLIFSALLPLAADEAYYWIWSLHPQLSYFDHPPVISWLIALGHPFDFIPGGIRWPSLLLGHLSLWIWYLIFEEVRLQNYFTSWVLIFLMTPFLGLGSIILTPDLPLMFFWPLSFLFFIKCLNSFSFKNSALLGTALGLGFLSKYMIVLFPIAALIYVFWSGRWSVLKNKNLLTIVLFGLISSSPVIIWNIQNNFSSFQYQLGHGLKTEKFHWQWPVEYFLGQLFFLFPLAFFKSFRSQLAQKKLFFSFAFVPLAFFAITSFFAPVEANWPVMGYPFLLLLAISGPWSRRNQIAAYSYWVVLYVVLFTTIVFKNGTYAHGKVREPFLYKSFVPLVDQFQPFYAINYQLASTLWYYKKEPVYKLPQSSRFDFFDTLSTPLPKDKVFYILKQTHHDLPDWLIEKNPRQKEVLQLDDNYRVVEISIP